MLKDQIQTAMKDAMRAKEKERLGAIRLILADIKRIEVDERIEITDDRIIVILDKMIKQRKDSIAQYQIANRQELAAVEQFEIDVIREFLPEPLTHEELSTLIGQAISNSGAESVRDMGKVMGFLKPQIQGKADAGKVSLLVKQQLS